MPERIVTNADLEKIVNTNDEWIRTRTGIEQRRWAEPGTPTSDLALRAVRECLDRRGLDPAEVDLIVVATVTPDTVFPATACVLQEKLGATRAWASTSRPPARGSSTPSRWEPSSWRRGRTTRCWWWGPTS